MAKETYYLTYFTEYGDKFEISFIANEYRNLMLLLFDKCAEEWGDCKGRAWCGTCHIQIMEGEVVEKMDGQEENTLSKLEDFTAQSRLACQIPVNGALNGIVFRIIPQT